MTATNPRPELGVVRLPGEYGPILRCSGELTVATEDGLQGELDLLLPLGHAVITVDLADCTFIDVDGILTLLHAYKELRRKGARMVLVAGTGRIARLLHFMGIERIIPLFPSERVAADVTRGGGPPEPGPVSWEEAREETIERWRMLQSTLEWAPAEEVLLPMTGMTALCERAEALFQERATPAGVRCQFCPLFHELGGMAQDVGCRSVLDPILQAVRVGDHDLARERIEELITSLEEMPLSDEHRLEAGPGAKREPVGPGAQPPQPWLPSALGDPMSN